nr:MAG TPA: hypothetical protein [Caudoviricetes sp.]
MGGRISAYVDRTTAVRRGQYLPEFQYVICAT